MIGKVNSVRAVRRSYQPRNRQAAHVVRAANLRKRRFAVIAALDGFALLLLPRRRSKNDNTIPLLQNLPNFAPGPSMQGAAA